MTSIIPKTDRLLSADEIVSKYGINLKKEKKQITILNISKCSVLELKEELERRGVYDEEDEKIWKKFKDLETKMWVEGYQKEKEDIAKEKEEEEEASNNNNNEKDEKPTTEKKMITEEEKAVEIGKRLTKPFALTFQEIEGWSMYELRQQMDQRKLLEEKEWENAYKLFEEMLAKVIRELLKGDGDNNTNKDKKEKKEKQKQQEEMSPKNLSDEWISDRIKEDTSKVGDEDDEKKKQVVKDELIDKETQKHLLAGQPVGANLKRNTNVNINELGKNEIPNIEDITVKNAPKLNIYQIRKVLERNDLFEEYKSGKKKISFEACLRSLVSYIVDKREKENIVYASTLEPEIDLKARLQKEKAERKAKAIERSRLRQIARKEAEAKAKAEEEQANTAAANNDTTVESNDNNSGGGGGDDEEKN